jgi:ribonucleoside-triphosphate reductase (thioredoxin)
LKASQLFTYTRTYSHWLEEELRRETYEESIERYINFFADKLPAIKPQHKRVAKKAIMNMDVMPSMRAFWAAGAASMDNSITLYNCSYAPVKDLFVFSEILFILMCGTGVGFSVERRFVDSLPELKPASGRTIKIVVEDSKDGWAGALNYAVSALWAGDSIEVDYSKIRPRGARLKTMGGRASGPEPLRDLFNFLTAMVEKRRARKQYRLVPINCLDIICKIAEIVVVGGVRRSSLICLFDADDKHVAEAKMGEFWREHPHRSMSNNSAVFQHFPGVTDFMEHWLTLIKSGSGEPGMFNRDAAIRQMLFSGRRKADDAVGTNPCGEISLKPFEFCNLSEVVVRSTDTLDTLKAKVKIATMFGCWQATQINFPYIRKEWKKNCHDERLLGVSLTGIMDNPVLNHVNDTAKKWLSELKHIAIREAAKWSKVLGTNMSVAITCVKPSGTVSQLVDSASGIHTRYARYYIRRYRISATDPLFRMMRDQGVPFHPEVGQEPNTASTWVLEFPIAAPKGCKTRHDVSAVEQLEHWKMVKEFWCEHNPSITVYVRDEEWFEVGSWCFENFDDLVGISFLPKENHVYRLAPYEEITKEQYEALAKSFPTIDYSQLTKYEQEDNTEGARSFACVAGVCEI